MRLLFNIFNFIYSPYFILLLLLDGILALISTLHQSNNNKINIMISKYSGFFYIFLAIIIFLFNQFSIFLRI